MKPWLRQGTWLAVALIVPVLLSLALLPLRDHVSDVLTASRRRILAVGDEMRRRILIGRADGTLTVQVRDDGAGGADAGRGSGLTGLRDRVEAVGGSMTIDSPAGAGTVLTVRLPVTAAEH